LSGLTENEDLAVQVMKSVRSKLHRQQFPHESLTYIYDGTVEECELREAIVDHVVYTNTSLEPSVEYLHKFLFDCLKGAQQLLFERETMNNGRLDSVIPYFQSLSAFKLFASFCNEESEHGGRQENSACSDCVASIRVAPLFITDDNSIADIQGKLLQYLVQVMSLF